MSKIINVTKKVIVIFMLAFALPLSMYSLPTNNFLPMEDAFSMARDGGNASTSYTKPYRQSFNLGSQQLQRGGYLDFTTADVCAFILLTGIYLTFVRRNSKARNASF